MKNHAGHMRDENRYARFYRTKLPRVHSKSEITLFAPRDKLPYGLHPKKVPSWVIDEYVSPVPTSRRFRVKRVIYNTAFLPEERHN